VLGHELLGHGYTSWLLELSVFSNVCCYQRMMISPLTLWAIII